MLTYQVGEFGVDVDARPANHGGQQCMKMDYDVMNLKLRHSMIYFSHRKPTEKQLETMTPVILTKGEV